MANINFVETAKQYLDSLQKLVDRLDASSRSLNVLTEKARKAEADKLAQEAEERKAKIEQDRQERLRQMFDSESLSAVHVGGEDEIEAVPVSEPAEAAKETVQPESAAAPAETPKDAAPSAEPVKEERVPEPAPVQPKKPEAPAQSAPAPQKRTSTYEARPITRDDTRRPQNSAYRPNQPGQTGGYQARPAAPGRNAGPQRTPAGPQRAGNAPRGNAPSRAPQVPASPIPAKEQRQNASSRNSGSYAKSFETDKKAKNKKAIAKEAGPSMRGWDEEYTTGGRRPKKDRQAQQHKPEPVVIEKAVLTSDGKGHAFSVRCVKN